MDWEGRGDGRVLGFAAGGEGAWDSDRLENGGTRFRLGRSNGPGAVAADVSAVSNDDSLVMRIQNGTQGFLLSADIEKRVENELVNEQAPLAADFLKVPASREQDILSGSVRGSRSAAGGGGFRRRRQPVWTSGGRSGGTLRSGWREISWKNAKS